MTATFLKLHLSQIFWWWTLVDRSKSTYAKQRQCSSRVEADSDLQQKQLKPPGRKSIFASDRIVTESDRVSKRPRRPFSLRLCAAWHLQWELRNWLKTPQNQHSVTHTQHTGPTGYMAIIICCAAFHVKRLANKKKTLSDKQAAVRLFFVQLCGAALDNTGVTEILIAPVTEWKKGHVCSTSSEGVNEGFKRFNSFVSLVREKKEITST